MKKVSKGSLALACGVSVMSLSISACGSSNSASTSASTSAKASGIGSTTTVAQDIVSQAKSEIAKYMGIPPFTPPGPSIETSKLRGKTIMVVDDNTVADALVQITKGIQAAGQLLGINVQTYNGQNIISSIEQGVQQGINQKVDAIMLVGIATSLVPSSVAAADAAKIPVISVLPSQPDLTAPGQGYGSGIFGGSGPSYIELGRLMADTAIVDSNGGPVNSAAIDFNNPGELAVISGIKSVFSKCSNCKILTTQDIEPQNWATKISGATSSLVLANPGLNYIFPTADTMAIFAAPGVSQAGATGKVSVVTEDGDSPVLSLIQKGAVVAADPGYSTPWIGWEAMDQALRAMSGMKPGNPVIPIRYFDKSNLSGVDVTSLSTLYGDAYVAGFKKLWGLS